MISSSEEKFPTSGANAARTRAEHRPRDVAPRLEGKELIRSAVENLVLALSRTSRESQRPRLARKIKFLTWCWEREDGVARFETYFKTMLEGSFSESSEIEGMRAAGWEVKDE